MTEYHKIQTVFKRDPLTNFKTLLEGEYSIPEFEYLQDNNWVFTEKVDGTNIRILYDGQGLQFKGKSDNAEIPSFLLKALEDKFLTQREAFAEKFGTDPLTQLCLYGEGFGEKIQKGGGNYRKGQGFVLFDVRIGHWWLQREAVFDIAEFLGLEIVPIIGIGTLSEMVEMARQGFNSNWGDFPAEGIVARPAIELKTRGGDRIITKIKHKDFSK